MRLKSIYSFGQENINSYGVDVKRDGPFSIRSLTKKIKLIFNYLNHSYIKMGENFKIQKEKEITILLYSLCFSISAPLISPFPIIQRISPIFT